MKIAILGTGIVGQTLGTKFAHLGHDVMMGSRSADNSSGVQWVRDTGPHASLGNFSNAARFGELVFNCTAGAGSLGALHMAGADNLADKVLIDTANPLSMGAGTVFLTVSNTDSLGEQIQRSFPRAKVVKALNTMNANVMVEPAKLPEVSDAFICGNDVEAKSTVAKILREWFGWKSVMDLGGIESSRALEMFVPFWMAVRAHTSSPRFNIKVVK